MKQKIQKAIQSDFVKKFSIYGFGQFFNLVTPLLLIPYIVKVCGEENFGKASIALALSFFLIVFIDYGSELVGVREVTLNRNENSKLQHIFLTNLVARFLVLLSVLFVSLLFIYFIPYLRKEWPLFLFSLFVIIGQYLNQSWFLQGTDNIYWLTASTIISKVIYVLTVLFFIEEKGDYIYINLCFAIGTIVSNGIITVLIFKKHRFTFYSISITEIADFLKRDFKMFSSQLFVAIQLYSPVILVGFIGNNFMAGQYKIVEQIIVTFKTYIFLFFNFTYPRVCHDLQEKPQKAIRNWLFINALNVSFVVIMMIVIAFNASFIIAFFNASNISELSTLLLIAVLIPILLAVSIGLKQLILGYNYQKEYVSITTFSVVISLLLIVILFPIIGLKGVFYSLLLSESFVILFYLFCISKKKNRFSSNNA